MADPKFQDTDQPFRLLITGSRDWIDVETINKGLSEYLGAPNVVLVSGACKSGADKWCEIFAREHGWDVERHPANWELYGKGAGVIRNSEMVRLGADACLAFIKNASPGTSDCVQKARAAGVHTDLFDESEGVWPQVLNASPHGPYGAPDQVFVGRPSKWGNPFVVGRDGTREEVIEKHIQYMRTSSLMYDLHELTGKNLVCFCKPLACHADHLLILANTE